MLSHCRFSNFIHLYFPELILSDSFRRSWSRVHDEKRDIRITKKSDYGSHRIENKENCKHQTGAG